MLFRSRVGIGSIKQDYGEMRVGIGSIRQDVIFQVVHMHGEIIMSITTTSHQRCVFELPADITTTFITQNPDTALSRINGILDRFESLINNAAIENVNHNQHPGTCKQAERNKTPGKITKVLENLTTQPPNHPITDTRTEQAQTDQRHELN